MLRDGISDIHRPVRGEVFEIAHDVATSKYANACRDKASVLSRALKNENKTMPHLHKLGVREKQRNDSIANTETKSFEE